MLRMTYGLLCVALCLPVLATGAETRQGGLSYSYVESGYIRSQVDFGNPIDEKDANSFGIQGSWAFPNAPMFIQAGYLRTEFEEDTVLGRDLDASTDAFNFGFGGHVSLAANTDLVLSADYLYLKADIEAWPRILRAPVGYRLRW